MFAKERLPCKGRIMPQSLSKLYVHLVFSTKERRALIQNKEELHAYIVGILANLRSNAIIINSMPDHIHILFKLSRTVTVADVVAAIKSGSTNWMKPEGIAWEGWQSGYGAFSVSESQLDIVRKYIERQEEHHAVMSFQDELRELYKKHRIDFDEKYVWD